MLELTSVLSITISSLAHILVFGIKFFVVSQDLRKNSSWMANYIFEASNYYIVVYPLFIILMS